MTKGARARRLPKIAQKRGFMLRKSRGPRSLANPGEFMIVDPSRNVVVANERFDLDLDAVEAWLADEDMGLPVES